MPGDAGFLSRAEIAERLAALWRAEPPKTVPAVQPEHVKSEMMRLPDELHYVCPTCGEQTRYVIKGPVFWLWRRLVGWRSRTEPAPDQGRPANWAVRRKLIAGLAAARAQEALLSQLNTDLDESQFCRRCAPGVELPQLVLVVRYSGSEPHRVPAVDVWDLVLLQRFLAGDREYSGYPMRDHLTRLEELLGVRADEARPAAASG